MNWILAVPLALAMLFLSRSGRTEAKPRQTKTKTRVQPFPRAARDLTLAQAMGELRAYEREGTVKILEVVSSQRVTLDPTVVGVTYQYLGKAIPIRGLDARFAVFLVRLARMLSEKYGATAIDTFGIYPGKGGDDVHAYGRAIDLKSISTPIRVYSVLIDWGQRPQGGALSIFKYRLVPSDPGFPLFRDIYNFAARQASDSSVEPFSRNPPTSIGDHSVILHPDHPDLKQRPLHQDHIHIQIGPTRGMDDNVAEAAEAAA